MLKQPVQWRCNFSTNHYLSSVQPQPQMKHPLQPFGNIPSSYLVTPQFVGTDFSSLSQSGMVPGGGLGSGLVQGGLSGLPNFKVSQPEVFNFFKSTI